MKKQTWTTTDTDAKKRLDIFLVEQLDDTTRSQIKKLIEGGRAFVNGKEATVHHFLKPGDLVEVRDNGRRSTGDGNADSKSQQPEAPNHESRVPSEAIAEEGITNHDLRIIKETKDWIVVHKPCGVLMHPDHDHETGTLIDEIVKHAPETAKIGEDPSRPGIVSRLDKDVSGLVVIAKTQKAFDDLKQQFGQHTVKKIYTALVYGEMEQEEGDIKFRIARSTSKARMSAIPEGSSEGQAAWTHYETVRRFRDISLLSLEIMTGRTHQIRAHLYASGHPIVGDILYKPKNIKRAIDTPRLLLQSTLLEFTDPASGERMHFELPIDDDFTKVIEGLKN